MVGLSDISPRAMPANFKKFYFALITTVVDNYFLKQTLTDSTFLTFYTLEDLPLEKYGLDYYKDQMVYVPQIENVVSHPKITKPKFLLPDTDATAKGKRPFVFSYPEPIYSTSKTKYISRYHLCVSFLKGTSSSNNYLMLMPAFADLINTENPTASFPLLIFELTPEREKEIWTAINNKADCCQWPITYAPPLPSMAFDRNANMLASLKASSAKLTKFKRTPEGKAIVAAASIKQEKEEEETLIKGSVSHNTPPRTPPVLEIGPIINTVTNELNMQNLVNLLSEVIKHHENPAETSQTTHEANVFPKVLPQCHLEHFAFINEPVVKYLATVNREEANAEFNITSSTKDPSHHIHELTLPLPSVTNSRVYSARHVSIQTSRKSSKEGLCSIIISPVFVQSEIHKLRINIPLVYLTVKEAVVVNYNSNRHNYECFASEIEKSPPPPGSFEKRNYDHRRREHTHLATSRTLPASIIKDFPPATPQLKMPSAPVPSAPKARGRKRKDSEHASPPVTPTLPAPAHKKKKINPTQRAETFLDYFTRDTPVTVLPLSQEELHQTSLESKKLEYIVNNDLKEPAIEAAEALTQLADKAKEPHCFVSGEAVVSSEAEIKNAQDSFLKTHLSEEFNFGFFDAFDVLKHDNAELVNRSIQARMGYVDNELATKVYTMMETNLMKPGDLVKLDPTYLMWMGIPGGLALEMVKIMNDPSTLVSYS